MSDHNHNHHHHHHGSSDELPPVEFDAASKSLSEALRISFVILKIIMLVLIVLFMISGFETVDSDELALVLRFGKIRGMGEARILKPRARPYWIFPYPIEEMVKIPVRKVVNLDIRSFWYHQTEQDLLAESEGRTLKPRFPTLDPMIDGYCLTRSEPQADPRHAADGTDYSIVHSKWQLRYVVDDPELFFRNVFVREVKPGDVYFDAMTESVKPLLQSLLEDAVVTAMVEFTIDDVIKSDEAIRKRVKELIDGKMPRLEPDDIRNMCGIRIESVLMTTVCPRQVREAFESSMQAGQTSRTEISTAQTAAETTMNEAGGPVAEELLAALKDPSYDQDAIEQLWSQLSGTAQDKIFEARKYQAEVVADAKANADRFKSLLPEYRKRPDIVLQSRYRDAIEEIFANAEEKFVVQPTEGEEIRIHLSRDPTIKRDAEREKAKDKKE
ncbi:MAG: SPFH domain-containing protein [Planctomycetota bacterium]|jgi:membrane protease subunit HflK